MGHFPCAVLINLHWWGGAAVRPDVCPPAHHWGHSQTGVYLLFPSPWAGIHCGVMWPVWATCTLPSLWCWGSGVLAGVDRQGARRGRGRLSSLFLWRSASGGALRHREGVRPAGGMDPQKHSFGCLCGASKFPGRNWFPLGFWLGDGQGRWHRRASLFPTKLSSVVWGSTTLPPIVHQPSRSLSRAVSL